MLDIVSVRAMMGRQAIKNLRKASLPAPFRGFPLLKGGCPEGCDGCEAACPTGAIAARPLSLDLGACLFCGECQAACPSGKVEFGPRHRLGADDRGKLRLRSGAEPADYERDAIACRKELARRFGRSLKLRQVSAGGCNACEMELNACGNVNFDMGRFGIDFVASPRHADGVVLTGPITANMAYALADTWNAVPEPKILVAVGACAISGQPFADSDRVDRDFLSDVRIDLYVPGCPPHPLTFINAVLDLLGKRR
jgi:Ni,Fe-hydrogenase III small subunit